MRDKRIVVALTIFVFIITLVILGSTVFSVNKIVIQWHTTTNVLDIAKADQYITNSNLKLGESVFVVNKKNYTALIEEENPYIRVVNIETRFPNQLVVHAEEREQLFALKVPKSAGNNTMVYVLLDYDLKVLSKTEQPILASNTSPAILEIVNLGLTESDFAVGKVANNLLLSSVLTNMGEAFNEIGYSNQHLKTNINRITINDGYIRDIIIETSYGSLKLEIKNAAEDLNNKILYALSFFEELHNNDINYGTVQIRKNTQGEIFGVYNPNN